MIKALDRDKLQDCLIERVPDDFALKYHLDGLIHRKMDDIGRYAYASQPVRFQSTGSKRRIIFMRKFYKPCETTVRNLANGILILVIMRGGF